VVAPDIKEETMTTTKLLRSLVTAVALGLAAASLAAAAGAPDKSGAGTTAAPIQLTLLNANDTLNGTPAVQRFVDRVNELSKGALIVVVKSTNDGYPGSEQRVIGAVRADKAQLAWVGTRVWDLYGVKSFRPLSAPMLIDSYPLEQAVLRSDLPAKMLAGLDGHGVVGLALLGDKMRYPVANRPLRGPEDFRGLRIRSYPSATQFAAFRALGARPSPQGWKQIPPAFQAGRLNALEVDLFTYQDNTYSALAPYVTLNVPLWPRTTVLFANPAALAGLTDEQRGWVQQAAADAAKYSLTTFGEDRKIIPMECSNGMKAALASPAQLADFRKAFAPVYASLRADPATASALDEIAALKKQVGPVPPPTIPSGCGAGASAQPEQGPAFPQGVFRGVRTRAAILRAWPNATAAELKEFAAVVTFRFENGSFDLVFSDGGTANCNHGSGRYLVQGEYVVAWFENVYGCPGLTMPSPHDRLRWTYDGKNLSFHLAQPASPLDIVTWTAVPIVKIG
jgi:TRAP-type C4-dicarboxylate transport system substrate-binding protein